jgi:hypothetical protein
MIAWGVARQKDTPLGENSSANCSFLSSPIFWVNSGTGCAVFAVIVKIDLLAAPVQSGRFRFENHQPIFERRGSLADGLVNVPGEIVHTSSERHGKVLAHHRN